MPYLADVTLKERVMNFFLEKQKDILWSSSSTRNRDVHVARVRVGGWIGFY